MREIEPILRGQTYHIYSRGINGENIFSEPDNYDFFLEKWFDNTSPVIDTYAYCLLKNHFHFLVHIKYDEVEGKTKDGRAVILDPSRQISHCLNGYVQAFNKVCGRHGGLLESPFGRKLVDTDSYFTQAIAYIHLNAQKHGFVDNFRDYPYSSYHLHLSDNVVNVDQKSVLDWFGGKEYYKEFHQNNSDYGGIGKYFDGDE